MSKRFVTQKDLAAQLDVSRETITKALQDHPAVSIKTKEKVKELAFKLGYTPNHLARNLVKQRSFTIGVIFPKLSNTFFAESVEYMHQAAASRGYVLIPMCSFENPDSERRNIETLVSARVDGIIADICYDSRKSKNFQLVHDRKIPLLYFDRVLRDPLASSVSTHDRKIFYDVTQMLIRDGYRKIAHFAGPLTLNIGRDRRAGFKAAMNDHGIEVPGEWIVEDTLTESVACQRLIDLHARGLIPEAVVCASDISAHGIYIAARKLGLKIPDDISVIGLGDFSVNELLSPPLCSIRLPTKKMADKAIDTLIQQIESETVRCPKRSKFMPNLILRGSYRRKL